MYFTYPALRTVKAHVVDSFFFFFFFLTDRYFSPPRPPKLAFTNKPLGRGLMWMQILAHVLLEFHRLFSYFLATLKYTQNGHQSDAGTLPAEGKMWAGGKTVRSARALALSCSALCHTPFIRTSTLEPQSQE